MIKGNGKKRSYKFSNSARRKSAYWLFAVFALTLLSLFALPKLQTQYSLRQFLPRDNALLERDAKLRESFQLTEAQPFILTARITQTAGTWFENDKIQPLKTLSDLLPNFPGVRSSLSLALFLIIKTGLGIFPKPVSFFVGHY